MKMKWIVAAALLSLGLGSLSGSSLAQQNYGRHDYDRREWRERGYSNGMIPQGTPIDVRLDANLSTDDSHQGDSWSGTVADPVVVDGRTVIPAGTPVSGVVTQSVQGTHDSHAQMGLAVQQVQVNGMSERMRADTEPIVAGTQRARKIGAIAGGAAAGALLGHAVGGRHSTFIGGVLGGAAGYGLTRHAFRTLVLKQGTVVQFTTTRGFVASR